MRGRLALLACLLACSSDRTAPPTLEPRVVVHAVIDPATDEQLVLVEETRVDSTAPRGALSARDLVASAGGRPISEAHVLIIGPTADDTAKAVEDRATRSDGLGAGQYRVRSVVGDAPRDDVPVGALRLVPGARYRLEVRTPTATVRGSTRLPNFPLAPDRSARRFDLDRDSLVLPQPSARVGAAAYVVRHVLPGFAASDRLLRTVDDRLLFPAPRGVDTWTFGAARGDIWPGTTQTFSIVGVDENVLRYSVAGADPFGDDVRGNTLSGGVGLFGSVAPLTDVALDLVAERDHAIEGDWLALGSTAGLPVTLRLYESPRFGAPPGDTLALTGTARLGTSTILVARARLEPSQAVALTLASSRTAANTRRYTGTLVRDTLTLQAVGSQVRMRYRRLP